MKILTPSLLIFVLFALGGAVFKSTAPIKCATILPGDRIFVLTGDARRIPFARRKLRQNPQTSLYIIGAGGSRENESDRIIVESDSKTTYQNAMAIKRIADQLGLNRIVLITTIDHINRAKYLVRKELPDIEIASCPAPLNGMSVHKRLERWTIEYIKYIGTLIGIKESR
ncbi:MAG: YdcF family protein [Rickettsiales bacterium]|jgi:uncharacterized SAM-binding protein YcdF (DUF218 family)|nr:YdcF family protein [Rickettsiales bacterium]